MENGLLRGQTVSEVTQASTESHSESGALQMSIKTRMSVRAADGKMEGSVFSVQSRLFSAENLDFYSSKNRRAIFI